MNNQIKIKIIRPFWILKLINSEPSQDKQMWYKILFTSRCSSPRKENLESIAMHVHRLPMFSADVSFAVSFAAYLPRYVHTGADGG